jgi:hypothetical protein
MISITYEEFIEKFKPIDDDNENICYFETYGKDFKIVKNYPKNKV